MHRHVRHTPALEPPPAGLIGRGTPLGLMVFPASAFHLLDLHPSSTPTGTGEEGETEIKRPLEFISVQCGFLLIYLFLKNKNNVCSFAFSVSLSAYGAVPPLPPSVPDRRRGFNRTDDNGERKWENKTQKHAKKEKKKQKENKEVVQHNTNTTLQTWEL